jgi:hypothetical protein
MGLGLEEIAVIDHFLDQSEVCEDTGCWIWKGPVSVDGYGVTLDPRNLRRPASTHEVAYRLMVGVIPHWWIPPRMLVLHACGNKRCVHPMHLRLVARPLIRRRLKPKPRYGVFGWEHGVD